MAKVKKEQSIEQLAIKELRDKLEIAEAQIEKFKSVKVVVQKAPKTVIIEKSIKAEVTLGTILNDVISVTNEARDLKKQFLNKAITFLRQASKI